MTCLRRPTAARAALLLAVAFVVSSLPWAGPATPGGSGAAAVGFRPAAAAAQDDGPVTLRFRAGEGDSTTYRFESRTHISPPPNMGMETTADAAMWMRRSVDTVEGDTLRLSVRIDSFTLDLSSDNEQVSSQLRQAEKQSRKNVVGETFPVSITRRGEMVETGSVAGGAGATQQLDRSFGQLAFAALPDDPVSVGESWSGTRTAEASSFGIPVEGTVVTETTSTLSRIFRRGGSRVAEISVEASFGFEPDSAASGGMTAEMSGSSARTIHFDVDEGRFLSASGAQEFTVNLSLPGREQGAFTLQTESESTVELVEG